jgi:hypothetical protein
LPKIFLMKELIRLNTLVALLVLCILTQHDTEGADV